MLGDAQLDVDEFLAVVMGQVIPTRPQLPEEPGLYSGLLGEECGETRDAMKTGDLPGIVDGCLDTIFVALNILSQCGVDAAPAWKLVVDANLAKAGGPVREDGKRMKPPGWTPPDIRGELIRQGWKP